MSERKEQCGTCRFREGILILDERGRWAPRGDPPEDRITEREYEEESGDGSGECRRYPPAKGENLESGSFPMVLLDGWCGEWREQEPDSKLLRVARRLVRLIELNAPKEIVRNDVEILDRITSSPE